MEEWLERVKRNEAKRKERLIKQCMKEGMEKGMERGIEKGIKKGIFETIKRMINMNLNIEIIKQATGVDENNIEKIRKELEKEITT